MKNRVEMKGKMSHAVCKKAVCNNSICAAFARNESVNDVVV